MHFREEMAFLCYLLVKDQEIEIKCISKRLLLKNIRTPYSKAASQKRSYPQERNFKQKSCHQD